MTNQCEIENQKFIKSLKDFIDTRAALVFGAVILGKKEMPKEQTIAVNKTESDLIKDSNALSQCQIKFSRTG